MKRKQTWQKPQLTNYGAVESVTQVSFDSLKNIKGFIALGKNLTATLDIGS